MSRSTSLLRTITSKGEGISVGPENKIDEHLVYPQMDQVEILNNTVLNSNFWGIHVGGAENPDGQYLKISP